MPTTTTRPRVAARKKIQKAQAKIRGAASQIKDKVQTKSPARKSPGTGGSGGFFRIEVRPKSEFKMFRTQDVGDKGHLERLAGKRESGRWDTVSWLISKKDAHVAAGKLVIDNAKARKAMAQLRGPIERKKGDVFSVKTGVKVAEKSKSAKPAKARTKVKLTSIKKTRIVKRTPKK